MHTATAAFFDSNQIMDASLRRRPTLMIGMPDDAGRDLGQSLSELGARVEFEAGAYDGVDALLSDPDGWTLAVLWADALGGLEPSLRSARMIRSAAPRIRVLIISSDFGQQAFCTETDGCGAVILRHPVSRMALRLGLDHLYGHLMREAA